MSPPYLPNAFGAERSTVLLEDVARQILGTTECSAFAMVSTKDEAIRDYALGRRYPCRIAGIPHAIAVNSGNQRPPPPRPRLRHPRRRRGRYHTFQFHRLQQLHPVRAREADRRGHRVGYRQHDVDLVMEVLQKNEVGCRGDMFGFKEGLRRA